MQIRVLRAGLHVKALSTTQQGTPQRAAAAAACLGWFGLSLRLLVSAALMQLCLKSRC